MSGLTQSIKRAVPLPVKRWIRSTLFRLRECSFQPYVRSMTIDGRDFSFWIADSEGRRWYDRDWVGREQLFLKARMVRPGDVVFDCGAHHGFMTVLFAHWVGPEGHVVSFEPVPANGEAVRRNIALNGLENVTFEPKAVGSREDRVHITAESNAEIVGSEGRGATVDVTYLDRYAHLEPTLLKIDVEGFEVEVLRGAREILARRPKLAIEIHTHQMKRYGTSVDDLLGLLPAGAYDLWLQWQDDEDPVPYDGRPITDRVHLFALPKP